MKRKKEKRTHLMTQESSLISEIHYYSIEATFPLTWKEKLKILFSDEIKFELIKPERGNRL